MVRHKYRGDNITMIPENVLDPVLYRKAVKKVTQSYGSHKPVPTGMAIVKAYKAMGGKYKNRKQTGTTRWLKERWIQIIPYLLHNEIRACGSSDRRKHACRPFVRVSKDTLITVKEIVKLHGKNGAKKLAMHKKPNSEKVRINWKRGKIKPV